MESEIQKETFVLNHRQSSEEKFKENQKRKFLKGHFKEYFPFSCNLNVYLQWNLLRSTDLNVNFNKLRSKHS